MVVAKQTSSSRDDTISHSTAGSPQASAPPERTIDTQLRRYFNWRFVINKCIYVSSSSHFRTGGRQPGRYLAIWQSGALRWSFSFLDRMSAIVVLVGGGDDGGGVSSRRRWSLWSRSLDLRRRPLGDPRGGRRRGNWFARLNSLGSRSSPTPPPPPTTATETSRPPVERNKTRLAGRWPASTWPPDIAYERKL